MTLKLITMTIGPWPMNAYIVIDQATNISAIIDPGAEAEKLVAQVEGTQVASILITHGHADHVGG